MNIFFLSWDVVQAARWHGDKHVVKMILETTQLLYSAHWVLRPATSVEWQKTAPKAKPYRPTHRNHPCAIWVRASEANYRWTCSLGLALCDELQRRRQFGMGQKLPSKKLKKQAESQAVTRTKVRQSMRLRKRAANSPSRLNVDSKPHASYQHLLWLSRSENFPPFPTDVTDAPLSKLKQNPNQKLACSFDITMPALAMPDEYKIDPNDPVVCYRAYYLGAKKEIVRFAYTDAPPWWPTETST